MTAVCLSSVVLAGLVLIHVVGHVGAVRILYLLPVWLATRIDGRRGGFALVVLIITTMLGEDVLTHAYPSMGQVLTEMGFRAISFSGIAWIIAGVEMRLAHTENLAMRDPLTGVHNRRALIDYWEAKVAPCTSQNSHVVVMIDCDGFKNVNDVWGHEAGDSVLKILGLVLESETRRTDLAARVGGDEFVLVLKETAPLEARRILRRVENMFETRVQDAGYICTLSVGCATVETVDQSIEEILAKADREMYRQKELKKASAFLN